VSIERDYIVAKALIWGASGGIGGALTSLLVQQGWAVYAAARTESRIPSGTAMTCAFDCEKPETFKEVSLVVAMETSGIDLVVYAAGGITASQADEFDAPAWLSVMNANLNGAQAAARVSLNLLREGGHMMFIGAHVDKLMLPRFSAYAAAKAGLVPLTTILQKENRKLKVSLVKPGAVDTPFWANVPFNLPAGAASPQAIAAAILQQYEANGSGELNL
jgi:3-oxoacyl-[acyl-carrier protein] reductase